MPDAIRPGSIRLIVGLGNPGKDYERTRHNAGFWLVERFAVQSGGALRKDGKYQALVGRLASNGAWLVLPQSFMNASGRAVQMLAGFLRGHPAGNRGGGIAGHNGLKDISQRLGSHDYWRLRLGIGHPGDRDVVADYVLNKPSAEDRAAIDGAIGRCIEILPLCVSGDMQGAMQKLHSYKEEKPVEKKPEPKAAVKPEPKPEARPEPKPAVKPEPQPEKPAPQGLFGSLFSKPRK